MKKVGKLTESSMVRAEEPKFYPLVSDGLFEAKVKVKKKLKEDDLDLPMNQTPEASKMTTNSPMRATKASVQVGGSFDLTDSQMSKRTKNETKVKVKKKLKEDEEAPPEKAPPMSPVQKDLARQKRLQQTIDQNEKLAGRTNEESVGPAVAANAEENLPPKEIEKINQQAAEWKKKLRPVGRTNTESTTPKPLRRTRARANAGRPLKRGTAKIVANDPGADMGDSVAAAEKLS